MKRFLAAFLALCLLLPSAEAVNTATPQTVLPVRVGGSGPIRPYTISIDTVDSDLTIYTPPSGQSVCVTGIFFSEASVKNVTWKSGSTTLVTVEHAASQGIAQGFGSSFLFCTAPGEALRISSSAAISSMLVNLVVGKGFVFP